jgi:serine protease Do
MQLRRAVAIAAALTLTPLGLAACAGPAPVVEDKPTATSTAAPELDEEKEQPDAPAETGFTTIFDDGLVLAVQVPDTWTQVDGAPVTTSDGVALNSVLAAPDLNAFQTSWDGPGVSFGATQDLTQPIQSYLDSVLTNLGPECDDGETGDYNDGLYIGTYLYLPNCGGVGTDFVAVAAMDEAQTVIVVVAIQMVSDEDKSTIRDAILNSFYAEF